MNLYWVTTEDHAEDWFVLARNAEEAGTLHEDMEGYDPGDATAEEIVEIPKDIQAEAGWPSDEVLLALGAKFLSDSPSRIVEIAGRRFCEGLMEATLRSLDDDIFEALGDGRPNETEKSTEH
jgi:hypothetical protein